MGYEQEDQPLPFPEDEITYSPKNTWVCVRPKCDGRHYYKNIKSFT